MLLGYPADVYEFMACTQTEDGALTPPDGGGWILLAVSAAEDGNAAILLATWARPKNRQETTDHSLTANS